MSPVHVCMGLAAQDEFKRPQTLSKGQICTIPKAKINESRKSNHAHRHRRTHTLPLSLLPGISVQTNQVQSDHRSKQLQSRPPDTVTQLVCTLEMQHHHMVSILVEEVK